MIKIGATQNMTAHLMTPDGAGPYPAVLLLHTSGGLQSADLDYARRQVPEGYVVRVPVFLEAYGIRPDTRRQAFTSKAQPIYDDFAAALEQLRSTPKVDGKKIAAVGFSNGGYFAVWLAATGKVQAGVSYYGALTGANADRTLGRFREVVNDKSSPVLVLHGTDDSTVPIAAAMLLDEILTAARASHEFQQYPGAGHNFERSMGTRNEAAAVDAWQRTRAFLAKTIR